MREALAVGVAYALAAGGMLIAGDAWATGSAFAVEYSAPVGCPSKDAFVADVGGRIADRKVADSDGQHFRVRIEKERQGYRGALETLEPASVREVGGSTCEEVARALVVFLALALNPPDSDDLSSASSPALRGEEPPPSPPPPSRQKDEAPASLSLSNSAGSVPERRPRLLEPGIDFQAVAATGVGPGIMPGGAIAVRLTLARRADFRWILHAGGLVAYREASALDGALVFFWPAARLDVGPALDLGQFRLSAGPVVHTGLLDVRARNLPSSEGYSAFWGDAGAFARVDVTISRAVALSLMVEVATPLQRKAFGIRGLDQPVHEIPPVFGVASLGVTLGK